MICGVTVTIFLLVYIFAFDTSRISSHHSLIQIDLAGFSDDSKKAAEIDRIVETFSVWASDTGFRPVTEPNENTRLSVFKTENDEGLSVHYIESREGMSDSTEWQKEAVLFSYLGNRRITISISEGLSKEPTLELHRMHDDLLMRLNVRNPGKVSHATIW